MTTLRIAMHLERLRQQYQKIRQAKHAGIDVADLVHPFVSIIMELVWVELFGPDEPVHTEILQDIMKYVEGERNDDLVTLLEYFKSALAPINDADAKI